MFLRIHPKVDARTFGQPVGLANPRPRKYTRNYCETRAARKYCGTIAACGLEFARVGARLERLEAARVDYLTRRRLPVLPDRGLAAHSARLAMAEIENRALDLAKAATQRAARIAMEAALDRGEAPVEITAIVDAETVRRARCGHEAAQVALRQAANIFLW